MTQLEPCPNCRRHVRTSEARCPFCGRDVAAAMQQARPRPLPQTRLGRAALFAFGVTVAATGLDGCADDGDDGDESEEEGNAMAIYGAPAPRDAEPADATPSAEAEAGPPDTDALDAGRRPGSGRDSGAASTQEDAGEAHAGADAAGKPPAPGKPDAGAEAGAKDAGRPRDSGGVIALYGLPPAPPVDAPVPIYGAPVQPKREG